jgi:catalase
MDLPPYGLFAPREILAPRHRTPESPELEMKKPARSASATGKASAGKVSASSSKNRAVASPDSARTTGGAARRRPSPIRDATSNHAVEQQTLAAAMRFNPIKKNEYGRESARRPSKGPSIAMPSPSAGASTLSETNFTAKTAPAAVEPVALDGNLGRSRVNSTGQELTTNQGVAVADNQNSLKAGLRGPTLLEDFILREKITHFDHERIPERIVHARGSAAHGYFEAYKPLTRLTRAAPFAEAGKKTPVFVRFSTVAGERGSADTARDVRGFAVKFYTDEGNWDLVGNNIPVFFIQDAMKFPDLIHAVKPEPHNGMPQAASAHDTFWDFVSLMPESTHMLLWVMSDRAIPRSLRMMQGFGVHTFRLVNEGGKSTFCKFHWKPLLGTHSLVWDEAVKIAGADADFHRRDLWEAIESGAFPEWELGLQVFSEEQADDFSFDVLDATKLIPEELVPVTPVGRMVLNRNPDNFFAETEQVAFCTAHVIPGIDFSNDPLLHGRIHSYIDTQITRLGGANFHEIPINAPLVGVHNNQRDGLHRQAISRGRVAYEPNSLGGGCPFQAGAVGFTSFAPAIAHGNDPVDKVRGKPEKFAEHYNQARLFFDSQSAVEKKHIIGGFRFELSKVTVPAIRVRMVASLRNVSHELAAAVASGLGMKLPLPMPTALKRSPNAEVTQSAALSLMALPGDGGIQTRKIAVLVAEGVKAEPVAMLMSALSAAGAVPNLIGSRLGTIRSVDGQEFEIDATFENMPAVLFDAMALPDGEQAVTQLSGDGHTIEFIKDQYRHGKTIFVGSASAQLLAAAGIGSTLPSGKTDPGLILSSPAHLADQISDFVRAIGKHRHPGRETDPPAV